MNKASYQELLIKELNRLTEYFDKEREDLHIATLIQEKPKNEGINLSEQLKRYKNEVRANDTVIFAGAYSSNTIIIDTTWPINNKTVTCRVLYGNVLKEGIIMNNQVEISELEKFIIVKLNIEESSC